MSLVVRMLLMLALPLLVLAGHAALNEAAAQRASQLDAKSGDAGEIRAATANGRRARVTVMLGSTRGASIRAAVDAVLTRHVDVRRAHGLTRAEGHPIFTLNATRREVESLAGDPRVTSISLDRQMTLSLDLTAAQ